MMNTVSLTNRSGGALASYAAWLQEAGPRLAAAHATAPLPHLVEAVLEELVDAGESFTAYDVTMILRSLFHPSQRLLPHYDGAGVAGVQPEVHRQMAGHLISGIYTVRTAYPNGVDPARLYVPVTRTRPAITVGNVSATYLTDDEWESVRAFLPPQKPAVGRPNADHRTVLSGIVWVQRTGRSWRQLPSAFGKWSTVYSRYRRWRQAGLWQQIDAALAA